jgi:hypothetical protein
MNVGTTPAVYALIAPLSAPTCQSRVSKAAKTFSFFQFHAKKRTFSARNCRKWEDFGSF